MIDPNDTALLNARADIHATLLETAASIMELDGVGLDPDQGYVVQLRRMAGALRAQAAIGKIPHRCTDGRYHAAPGLPPPLRH